LGDLPGGAQGVFFFSSDAKKGNVVGTERPPPRILVVDADFQIRSLLEGSLAEIGAAVLCAATGGEARRHIAAGAVDLAFISVSLADGDGETLADLLGLAGTRVILMSGHPEGIRRGMATRHVFLAKPFSLREALRHALELLPPCKAE
jgi:DNA-binding response OmpR family regulator